MNSTRGRNDGSLLNFAMQDFGALSGVGEHDDSPIRLVMPELVEHVAPATQSHSSAAPAPSLQRHTTNHDISGSQRVVSQAGDARAHAAVSSYVQDNHGGHHVFADTSNGAIIAPPANGQGISPSFSLSSAQTFAGAGDMSVVAAPQILVDTSHSRQGDFHFDAASHGGGDPHILPPSVPVAGQLWFGGAGDGIGNPDGHSDFRIEHADSDGLSDDQIVAQEQNAGGINQTIALDTSAGLFFSLSEDFHLRVSSISTGAFLTDTVVASTVDQDVMNCFAVNPVTNTIFAGLFGYDYLSDGGDIIKITYNQTTGAITNPYSWNDTTHSFSINLNNVLIDSTSTGHVYADARAMYMSHDGSTLYYVDDNNADPGNFWGFKTNGVFKVSTTGSVGGGNAPTPTLLSNQAQFPVNDSSGYITGLAVDEGRSIIYFTTSSTNPSTNVTQNAIWWMPITGGTATKMTIPGGVSVTYPTFYGDNIEIDPKSHTLYYADQVTGEVVQFVLAADGHSFTSATNFALFDSNHTSDGAYVNSMVFDDLPTLASLSATTTEAVQGGSAITLLTAAASITDIDNVDLHHFTITITNAQSGDNLFCNGAQSGTISGVTISWNSSTHALTLSGDVSFATYQTLLSQISFQDSGTDNSTGSHPTRIINWTANDGVTDVHASLADSNEQITTVVIDRAPTLTADNYAVVETATVTGTSGTAGTGVLGNDTDKDADAIVVTAVNGSGANVGNSLAGTYGHLTLNSNGSYSYVADNAANIASGATGSHLVDTFTYTVSDGLGGVTTTTVSFTIDRVPTVVTDSGAAVEGASGSGNVLTNDSDRDGDSLTVSAVNGVGGNVGNSVAGTYGHITIASNGSYTYNADNTSAIDSAATGSHLTDTFTYTANDGHGGTTTTTITVTLDRPPTVVADAPASEAVESGTHATGNVLTNDSDRDGDSLTVSLVNGLAGNVNASVAGTYGHITIHGDGSYDYTADKTAAIDGAATGAHLTDSFTYQASDGHGGTASQTLTVTIDRAPTVVSDAPASQAVESGSAVNGNVLTNDSDRDGDTLVVSAVNGVGGNVGSSVAGTYGHITINSNGSYSYSADNSVAIDAAATGSHLTDTFSYTASDGLGGTTTTNIVVTIDRAPTVVSDAPASEALESGSSVNGNVLSNDSDRDGDTLVVSAVNGVGGNVGSSVAGTYGHITIGSNGVYSYTADNSVAIDAAATGSHLTDTFSYTASDGHGGTTTTNIVVTIDRAPTVVSDAPASDAVESGTHATGNVLTNDSDRDGDTLTVSAVNGLAGNVNASVAGTYGHITIHGDGSYDYTADNTAAIDGAATGAHLTDTFSYTASDGLGGTTTTNIVVTLDRAPTVVNDSGGTVAESGSASANAAAGVLTDDSDRDGDTLTISAVGGSAGNVGNSFATTYGHITLNADGSYTYNADNTAAIDAAANGSHPLDTITFTVSDGFGGFTNETLTFTLDRPAVANADSLSTTETTDAVNGSGGNPNLLANDVDKDGDAITITQVNGSGANVGTQIALASGALLTVNADGTYTYDPNHAFDYLAASSSGASDTSATDTFTYTVDGGSQVTVTITVNGVDSNDTLIGTTGNDTINAGIGNDIIYDDNGLNSGTDPHDTSAGHSGGTDAFNGGSGDDTIFMGANLIAGDQIDGGTNNDTVNLNGNYSGGNAVVFNATTMVNVETLSLTAGHSYNLTMANATVGLGQTMTVDASTLGAGDALVFDASADTTGGNYVIQGGLGNDTLTGGNGNDIFRVGFGGGTDTIVGGGGNDKANFHGGLTAADSFDGGAGNDEVYLNGNYSAGLTLGATTFVSVETLVLVGNFTYNLTMNAATVAAGNTMTVRAATLGPAHGLTFNASADTAGGNYLIYSGSGNDVLTGGNGNDLFSSGSGTDTVHAGGGNDVIEMNGNLTAADTIDGGSGTDTLFLSGDYSSGLTLGATTVTNIERITLKAGHSYNLTIDNATVTAGHSLALAGNALGASDSFVFDGSHDTTGGILDVVGGAGNDTLTGGWANDIIKAGNGTNMITGGGGSDILMGGTGVDTFVYNAVADSTSTHYDRVENFDANADFFKLTGVSVNGIDTAITSGVLQGGAHFDAELAAAVDGSHLAAHDAVLFTADSGNLAGHTFLVVDVNGVAGYQTGQDFVIDVTGSSHLTSLSAGNFI